MANCLNLLKRSQNYVTVVQSLLQRIYKFITLRKYLWAKFCSILWLCSKQILHVATKHQTVYCLNVVLLFSLRKLLNVVHWTWIGKTTIKALLLEKIVLMRFDTFTNNDEPYWNRFILFCFAFFREPISNNSESSSKEGTCPGIPSGVIIEMLVTDAGKYGGVPQMEIVGTRIK